MAYWHDKANHFSVYDKRFAQEARLSTVHFRRLKAEMSVASEPLSLFLTQKETTSGHRYQVVEGQTKPRPTTYFLRLDDPLTPADAHHLATWLQQEAPQRRAETVTAVLQSARTRPRTDLLSPQLAPYLADMPAQFQAVSVLDVVRRVYGTAVAQHPQVKEEAEALHTYLTGIDYYGKEYFRVQWLNQLKPGAAYLITYLRSLCFYDEATGELRNEVTFTRPELADNLGVTTKTLVNWLDKLESAVPQQALGSFMTLLEQQRLSSNDVLYRYKIEMLEPFTPKDLTKYRKAIAVSAPASSVTAERKNDHHDAGFTPEPQRKNDHHDFLADGKNDHHDALQETLAQGKNDHHDRCLQENLITGQGKNENGWMKKRWPYKYYKTLTHSLNQKNLKALMEAADCYADWKSEDEQALRSLTQVVCDNDMEMLFDVMNVDKGGPSRQRMRAGGLDITEVMAWYLYAQSQPGLSKPPTHLTVARVQAGLTPPTDFLDLASLSWELWRCYACLLVSPPSVRESFRQAPAYDLWMQQYGRCHPDTLPFAVGRGVCTTVNNLLFPDAESGVSSRPGWTGSKEGVLDDSNLQKIWQSVLHQLSLAMTKATFNSWLKDTKLLQVIPGSGNEAQHWSVGVASPYGVEWLENRLNKQVIEPMATAVCGKEITISYMITS
ncbi:MAG: hypothetical protein H6658_09940 [Ardenticatenaceae bacterium]|nr:hypothetical protein [Ardenticatenaceae bacterium]